VKGGWPVPAKSPYSNRPADKENVEGLTVAPRPPFRHADRVEAVNFRPDRAGSLTTACLSFDREEDETGGSENSNEARYRWHVGHHSMPARSGDWRAGTATSVLGYG
jgi:hypothetical protein